MMRGILLSISATVVYGLLAVSYEAAGKKHYEIWDVVLLMQLTGFLIGLVISGLLHLLFFNFRLFALGIVGAATFVASLGSYLMASRQRDIAANWTIVNLSVVLPILFSVLWFHDTFSVGKAIAVVLMVVSVLIISRGLKGAVGRDASVAWFEYIGLAFFFNAWVPILLRFVSKQQSALFTTYLYGVGFLVVLMYKLLIHRRVSLNRGLIGLSVAAAGTHWSGIMLTIAALTAVGRVSSQAGIVVYPITNGLVIPSGVLLGRWILKERMDTRAVLGVVLGVAALVFLVVG